MCISEHHSVGISASYLIVFTEMKQLFFIFNFFFCQTKITFIISPKSLEGDINSSFMSVNSKTLRDGVI